METSRDTESEWGILAVFILVTVGRLGGSVG